MEDKSKFSKVISQFKEKTKAAETSVSLNLNHEIVEVVKDDHVPSAVLNKNFATEEEISQWNSMVKAMGVGEGNA